MTRFARAKGSKGSKERAPEEATSWREMKKNNTEQTNSSQITKHKKSVDSSNSISKHNRRKPLNINKIVINGIEIELAYFDGFPIKKSDADRLIKLRKDMISKGIPRKEIGMALKLERRKAEKALAREKKKVCFNCRRGGHTLSDCPMLQNNLNIPQFETGICFKCGSTEHTHFECKVNRGENFKFAQCFICKEQGHIAKQCPANTRGIYPKGGACNLCGDVTHLRKDCQLNQTELTQSKVVAHKINENHVEALEDEAVVTSAKKSKKKIIKF